MGDGERGGRKRGMEKTKRQTNDDDAAAPLFYSLAAALFHSLSLSLSQPQPLPPFSSLSFSFFQARSFITYVPSVGDAKPRTITLIPGDGIGPEISHAVEDVVAELGAPIEWERFPEVSGSTPGGEPPTEVPKNVLDSIRKNKVCFKGTLFTPLSKHNTSTQSLNVQLRKGERKREEEERGKSFERERERRKRERKRESAEF
jgi:hypothetical protein